MVKNTKFPEDERTFETRLKFIKEIFTNRYEPYQIMAHCIQHKLDKSYETYVKERLNEIEKMRVTDATIQQIIQDLTQICLKIKIKEDDEKIEALNSLVLKHNQDRSTSEELLTTKIDNANSQITALTLKIKEIEEEKSKLSLENNELKNQLGIMTQELITNKEKYSYLEGVTNLLKRGGSDPDCIDKLFDELKIKHKHAKGEN